MKEVLDLTAYDCEQEAGKEEFAEIIIWLLE